MQTNVNSFNYLIITNEVILKLTHGHFAVKNHILFPTRFRKLPLTCTSKHSWYPYYTGTGWTDDRFVFELDEPGDKLPGQTRKYVAYFSEVMILDVQADGAYFAPAAGGQFTGVMQVSLLPTQ